MECLLRQQSCLDTKGNQRIRIGGVGDHCEDLRISMQLSKTKSDFVILLSHSPDFTMDFPVKVDLILSGIPMVGKFLWFVAPKLPSSYGQKFRSGHVITGNVQTIISNGIGTVFLHDVFAVLK